MQKRSGSESALCNPRILVAFTLSFAGVCLAMLSFAANSSQVTAGSSGNTSTGPGWSAVTSPNVNTGPQVNALSDVTCVSASDCWAVGSYHSDEDHTLHTLIVHWDGTAWALVSSPNTSATQNNELSDVTCVSATDCWAVGKYRDGSDQTLVEHWDGTSWSIAASPNTSSTQHNSLYSVTCTSASACWAVGDYINSITIAQQTLIERWDGTSWTIVASPNTDATANFFRDVTCTSPSACWAVGAYYYDDEIYHTLIARWDGISWSILESPNIRALLWGVTCASAADCWAVGNIFVHWDGASWSLVSSPEVGFLSDISCSSASDCWAVGSYYSSGSQTQTLIKRWDGISWSTVTSPNGASPGQNAFNGLICTSASECWTVGYYSTSTGDQTLVARWNGTSWAIVASPNNNTEPRHNYLYDVACASTNDCWAVGNHVIDIPFYPNRAVIERWDGTSWSTWSSGVTQNADILYAVTCSSASDCWAVGYELSWMGDHTVIAQWDGTSWVSFGSPDNGRLLDVTCASTSDCWAIGFDSDDNLAAQPFIKHWNGTTWSTVNSPSISTNDTVLQRVTCASGSDCWAVGYYRDANFVYRTLIEHWDGSAWAVVESQNTGIWQNNWLLDLTCASASDCWAVGHAYNDYNRDQTLIEHWDGSSWAIVSSPSTDPLENNMLASVACASASQCWAVGHSESQTLIEVWDGTAWAIAPLPRDGSLNAVTCPSTSNCWAVGEYPSEPSGWKQTLIEIYSSTIPPLTSVGSRKIHDSAPFDIDLMGTTPGIECRNPGATGTPGIDHKIVFNFVNDVGSCGTASIGSLSTGPNLNQCTVDLTGVSNQQYVAVSLNNVLDAENNSGNVSATMGLLVGDVNASTIVTSGDTNLCKAQALQPVTNANFRNDINASGSITTGDVNLIKQNALSQLSSPP